MRQKQKAWIGIDPGKDGCLCKVTDRTIVFHDRISTEALLRTIYLWRENFQAKFMLEKVDAIFRPQKKTNKGISPGFFGRPFVVDDCHFLRGVLTAMECDFVMRTAIQWQTIIPQKKKKGDDNKARSIKWALEFYPEACSMINLKKHNNRADALLMAHWLKNNEENIDGK